MAEMVSKVSEKIKNVANATAKKTKSAANIAKYAVKMRSLNYDLKRLYEKLGAAYYASVMLDGDDEVVATRVSEIVELKGEIECLSKKIKRARADFSKKTDEPIEAEFEVVDEDDEYLDIEVGIKDDDNKDPSEE